MNPLFDDICPPIEGELIPLHERAYVVRAYRRSPDALVLRGAVRDQKPPGLYIADDPDVITVHHMIVDLTIVIPSMEITEANVVIEVHPDPACPTITARYDQLVGLSIARGYTHRIRELFGGPRGCSHTTALLQAMGPVAMQSIWSFRVAESRGLGLSVRPPAGEEERQRMVARNLNTCHIWAEGGEHAAAVLSGTVSSIPIPFARRLEALGRDVTEWAPD